MNIQTYLYFARNCGQAIETYQRAFRAEVLHLTSFGDAPEPLRVAGAGDLVFHATLRIGETLLNLNDDPLGQNGHFESFALLVHLDSAEAVDASLEVLSEGGEVLLLPQETMWATRYAIVADPFGITWKLQYSA